MGLSQRNIAIDIIKGISILLVVYGHSPLLSETSTGIVSFRMALFFYTMGLFAKLDMPLTFTFKKKFLQLLKPYFIVCFSITVLFPRDKSILYEVVSILYGSQETLRWLQLWFLSHAFILFMTAAFLFKICNITIKTKPYLFLLLLFIICIIGAYDFQMSYDFLVFKHYTLAEISFPFGIDRLPASLLFFFCGYITKQEAVNFKKNYFLCTLALITLIGLQIYCPDTKPVIATHMTSLKPIMISLINSIMCIYVIWHIAYIIAENTEKLSLIFSYIGKRSLWILIFHLATLYKTCTFLEDKIDNIYLISAIAYVFSILVSLIFEYIYRTSYIFLLKKYKFR